MNLTQRLGIYLLVLFSGTTVLVLEVLGVRMLAPYFGQTLFSLSSVLGVVLAALSIGYYLGGSLGDKKPKGHIFFAILGLTGLMVVATMWMDEWVMPWLGKEISLIWGPLVGAILLLFPASLLLGMLCPFSIAFVHAKTHDEHVGRISGLIFLVSTIGSIAGSLLSGFWLIPHWGVDLLLNVVAISLLVIGMVTWIFLVKGKQRFLALVLLLLGATGVVGAHIIKQHPDPSIVFEQEGRYDHIRVKEMSVKGQTARFLYLDRGMHNGVIVKTGELLLDYTKHYAFYKLIQPDPKNILFLGGGAYSVPYVLLKELPQATLHVAEIDPTLWQVAQDYFNIKPNPRLINHFMDARVFLQRSAETFDFIYSDAFGSFGQLPYHLVTQEFFSIVHEKLNDDGVFIINYPGSLADDYNNVLISLIKTAKSVFPTVQAYATMHPEKFPFQNYTIVLAKQKVTDKNWYDAIEQHPSLKPLLTYHVNVDRLPLEKGMIWTDSYQDVEFQYARFIRGMAKAGFL